MTSLVHNIAIILLGEEVVEWSEHGGELDDPRSNPAGTWQFFQDVIEWPKKPTYCYSTLCSTVSASETQ